MSSANLSVQMALVITASAKPTAHRGFLVPGDANKRVNVEFQFILQQISVNSHP